HPPSDRTRIPSSSPTQTRPSEVTAIGGSHVLEKPSACSQSHRHDFPASLDKRRPKVARTTMSEPSPPGTVSITCAFGKRPFARAEGHVYDARAAAMERMSGRAFTILLYLVLGLWGGGCKKAPKGGPANAAVPIPPPRAAYVTNNGSDSVSV